MKRSRLELDNLLLREITKDDIELIRSWRNQENIREWFIDNKYIYKQQQQEWFKMYLNKKDDIMFMIEETLHFQSAIGTVALYNINKKSNSAEFGRLMIGHFPSVGKGFGKRASILACKYAFEILNLSELYLSVLVHNTRAIQLYSDIGFSINSINSNSIHMTFNKSNFQTNILKMGL